MSVTEEKFNAAVNVIRSLPKDGPYQPSNDMMLKFYSLYKQATEGPCTERKPSFYEVVKGYKWRAWNSLGSMTKANAMNAYVEELKKIVETMSYSVDVATFIEALGPFYEYVDTSSIKTSDTNHNITEKSLENYKKSRHQANIPENGSLPYCNGKKPSLINGNNNSSDTDSDDELTEPSNRHSPDSENGYFIVNGIDSQSDTDMKLAQTEKEKSVDLLKNDSKGNLISTIIAKGDSEIVHGALQIKMSDTESDEEYSEPAETPELLQQKQRVRGSSQSIVVAGEGKENQAPAYPFMQTNMENFPVKGIVTCGGGDASDAVKVGLSASQQSKQGSTTARRQGESPPSELRAPVFMGGSGRRRRDSDSRRFSDDVNAQLILILQKIHQDLQAVVLRLDNLEAQALNHHQDTCNICLRRLGKPCVNGESSWWPFPELSPRSTFFLLTWPLILHGAVKLLLFVRSRRKAKK